MPSLLHALFLPAFPLAHPFPGAHLNFLLCVLQLQQFLVELLELIDMELALQLL
jgi:hypothetical protein